MNNFREGLNALKEISDPEKMKMALERITGKKLADYEGIDALVEALMKYYNGELERKLNTNGGNVSGSLIFTNTNPLFPMIVGRRYNNDLNNRIPTIQGGIVYSTVQDRASERNLFPATNNACGILSLNTHEGAYGHQLGFSDQGLFHRIKNSGNFSLWRKVINDKNPEYLGQIGVNSIEYIQDNIQKIEGKGYFDKITGKLYKCIKNTDSRITSVNAEYFEPADNISISSNSNKTHVEYVEIGDMQGNQRKVTPIPSNLLKYSQLVVIDTEVYYNSQWGSTGDMVWENTTAGCKCHILGNNIITRSGTYAISAYPYGSGNPFEREVFSGKVRAVILCIE